MCHTHKMKYYSCIKTEKSIDTHNEMSELKIIILSEKKSCTKEHVVYYSIYIKLLNMQTNYSDKKQIDGCLSRRMQDGVDCKGVYEDPLGVMEMLCFDQGSGFTGVYICHDSLNRTL